jgi:NAD(P)-dependent dehydrogenase (short-subunit alcohol dehydrogenase family)
LGQIVAHRLAESGARLALVSTSAEKLEKLGRELKLPEDRWLALAADMTRPEAADYVKETVLGRFGRADLLLHFVGGWVGGKPVTQVAAEELAAMLQQHVWSTFYLAQAFIPHLVANGWGRIVVVSSPSAAQPPAHAAPYAMGKAAQEALMLTLAEELKNTGVTANVVRVRTIDVNHARDLEPAPANVSWTTPEEIAAAIYYLCSDEARMMNGARLPLYGSP